MQPKISVPLSLSMRVIFAVVVPLGISRFCTGILSGCLLANCFLSMCAGGAHERDDQC